MAGWMKSWRTLELLILFSLLSLTEHFDVRDDELEELRPEIAVLHRLRALPEHIFHERLNNPSNQRFTSIHGATLERSFTRVDIDQNPLSLQDDLQECKNNFTACVLEMRQDFESFLRAIDEHKIQSLLLRSSEISHSYSQKLLFMTDKEKSTNDRVQQEYRNDPHYSVIVSPECLYNASCQPENYTADNYTVVKIFGSVSEDGQSLSGLSGSSLAELMLKLSLEAVAVFSLDGNTTTDFQHNFLRVFVVHGIKAVLETNQENHQIYQVMSQVDSVSRYQIPQRPIDHSTQYDHQQILIMEDDPVVRNAATYLYEKHPTVSSVYVLDKNQKPKLIHGDSVPLSEDSRLVLVGHGKRDNSGEMTLAGYRAQEVAKIIQQTPRLSDQIKTTSVVACEVGKDKAFVETLLRDLYETAGIKTELHLRDTLVQVSQSGEKITQEISTVGLQWRNKDDSKKVVATLDRNGEVIIRNKPGSKGMAVFTNERNVLMPRKNVPNTDGWPQKPQRFIDENVFGRFEHPDQVRSACDELEALSWGFFYTDLPLPQKIDTSNLQHREGHFLIGKKQGNKINWIEDEWGLQDVLSKCYDIKSGKDIRSIIRHYAKTGENKLTYLMVNEWIYVVDPKSLYVYLVGKKLDHNTIRNEDNIKVKKCIVDQIGKERYSAMHSQFETDEAKNRYAQYVKNTFLGEHGYIHPPTEAWCTTYFIASVISESARNFRTFPLILMALDMVESSDNSIQRKGLKFFFEEHSMAHGGSWIDTDRRGFSGSAKTQGRSMTKLETIIRKEFELYQSWNQMHGNVDNVQSIMNMLEKYKLIENDLGRQSTINEYRTFKESSKTSTSGILGGYSNGHTTSQDLKSATELENSFKLESYFSRVRALSAEQIHSHIKAKSGRVAHPGGQCQNGKWTVHI